MMEFKTLLIILLSIIGSIYNIAVIKVMDNPPQPWQIALMARYIIHKTDWVSIATLSTHENTLGFPFVNLKSMCDGPVHNGTGIPYIFLTDMDISGQDLKKDKRCTVMATLADTDYCRTQNLDPQDPRCARVIISGKLVPVKRNTKEYKFSKDAMFSRHPSMATWPTDHEFYFTKVKMQQILVLDNFGGIKNVSIKEYFNARFTDVYNFGSIASAFNKDINISN